MNSDQRLADYNNPLVRKTAERLTGNTNTVLEKLDRLFHYVRDDIKFGFTQDGDLMKASTTIRLGKGQCNTKGTLLLALCKAVGIPARIHFSLIKKEIQRGLFTGLGYKLMAPLLSHSWIEAGSFVNYLVEEYGEQKLKELHDSWSLNYKSIYSKDLKELAIEWQEFVFE